MRIPATQGEALVDEVFKVLYALRWVPIGFMLHIGWNLLN